MSRSIEKTGDINDFIQRELETIEREVTHFDKRVQVAAPHAVRGKDHGDRNLKRA
jgi:hypothetical protein